ncbi:hypothetical protein ABZP36_034254 [Zizania latifolia]
MYEQFQNILKMGPIGQIGKLSTGDSLDMPPHDESAILSNDATIKDMEGASVAYVAGMFSTLAIFVKAVTDVADGEKPTAEEFLQNLIASFYINLFGMSIEGTLSDVIGNLTALRTLALIGCSFSGTLPSELGNLSQLEFFALNSNKFMGHILPSLCKLSKVTLLDLADNNLNGPIPNSRDHGAGFDQLIIAQHFHLNQNMLQGSIPDYLFNSSMALKHILLDRNNFSEPIPASIGVLPKLEALRVNDNAFTGPVPAINNLTKLHVLMLSNNKLSGLMPNLTGMVGLENVDLSNDSFGPSEAPSWFTKLDKLMTLQMQHQTNVNASMPLARLSRNERHRWRAMDAPSI